MVGDEPIGVLDDAVAACGPAPTAVATAAVIAMRSATFIRRLDGSLGVSQDQLRAYCIAMLLVAFGAPEARRAGC